MYQQLFVTVLGKTLELRIPDQETFGWFRREFSNFVSGPSGTIGSIDVGEIAREWRGLRVVAQVALRRILEWLQDRYLFLHGSCIERSGCARAFVGSSGSGKTLVALYAALNGWRILADDVMCVERTTRWVYPFLKTMRIRPHVARFLKDYGIPTDAGDRVPDAGEFWPDQLPEAWVGRPARLGRITLLDAPAGFATLLANGLGVSKGAEAAFALDLANLLSGVPLEHLNLSLKDRNDWQSVASDLKPQLL